MSSTSTGATMTPTLLDAQIPVVVLVDDHTLLLYGSTDKPLPTHAAAFLDRDDPEGRFLSLSWPGEEGSHWFLALVHAPELRRQKIGRIGIMVEGGRALILPRPNKARVDGAALLGILRESAAAALPAIADFLHEALLVLPGPKLARLFTATATLVAESDGFAEIFGRIRPEGGLVIQGWSRLLAAGSGPLVVESHGDAFPVAGIVGRFPRPDLPSEAHGVIAVLPDAALAPDAVRRLFHRGPGGWCCLDLYEQRTVLAEGLAGPHLRDMLGKLDADADALRLMRRWAHARYEGVETVSRLDAPVHVAFDLALQVPGHGVLLQGWLLDPEGRVQSLTLRGPCFAAAVDSDWTRTPRPDVTEAFAEQPVYAGKLFRGLDDHGFLAWLPGSGVAAGGPTPDAGWHLELVLQDGSVGFLPVSCTPPNPDLVRRLLNTVDINAPEAEQLVARQIGPALQAVAAGAAGPVATPLPRVHGFGRSLDLPRLSVILPVTDLRTDIDVHLARFAIDPDFAEVDLLVATGAGGHERFAGNLRRAADFYGLAVRLVQAPRAQSGLHAADAALTHAKADRILLLSAAVVPTACGWLSELEEALDDVCEGKGGDAIVSPTLLHEDWSVRFAGWQPAGDRTRRGQSWAGLTPRYAGYPAAWLKEKALTRVSAATLDCALTSRRVIQAAGGLAGRFLGQEAAGIDFSLRASAAGHGCWWAPGVQLVAAPDDGPGEQPYWQRTGRMVDLWALNQRWAASPLCLPRPAAAE